MYLLSQMTGYLLAAFLLGVAAGYGLWRVWGEQDNIEKYKAAERRLLSISPSGSARHSSGRIKHDIGRGNAACGGWGIAGVGVVLIAEAF